MAEQTQLLSTWSQHFPGVAHDVNRFYAAVEAAVQERKVPDVKFSRESMKEGGLFSSSREYLRIKRGDLRYDICGAPFANGFFVSSRLFAEGKFADSLLGGLGSGGVLSQLAGNIVAKAIGADTYYKFDTAQMYLQLVHRSLLDAVDGLNSAARLPLLTESERKPILQGFFQ